MFTSYLLPITLIIQIVSLFFLSRLTINEFFYFLRMFLRNEHLVYTVISLFFLPGTIVHEMGHFLAATILMLQVYDVRIFPQWEKNQIKLGSVLYEKKDFLRGIIVGIAPIFFAFGFFWILAKFHLFPNINIGINVLLGYVVFAVSSTMFSSKQDLVDFAFIIPLTIIIIGLIYVFNLKVDFIFNNKLILKGITGFFKDINFYLLFSLIVNVVLIFVFKSFRSIFKK